MLRISLIAGLALLAAACGGSGGDYDEKAAARADGYSAVESPPMAAPAPAMEFARSLDSAAVGGSVNFNTPSQIQIIQEQGGGGGGQPAPPGAMMAYTYGWNFAVPTGNMEDLLNAHKKACEDAGPAKCYVTSSNIEGIGEEQSSAYLSMRATEDWVRSFEGSVKDGLKPFGASVYSNNRSAEDLTTEIVDIDARLKSQIATRDSLQEMLRNRPGRLSDLLEIQRELANVQGNIDSQQSIVSALKLRVSMSVVNFSYRPEYEAVSESIWRPLADAFGAFAPNFAETLANMVEWLGSALPVIILLAVAVLVLWILLRRWGRRGKRKAPAAVAPAAKPAAGTGG
jgi:hypothetical protein